MENFNFNQTIVFREGKALEKMIEPIEWDPDWMKISDTETEDEDDDPNYYDPMYARYLAPENIPSDEELKKFRTWILDQRKQTKLAPEKPETHVTETVPSQPTGAIGSKSSSVKPLGKPETDVKKPFVPKAPTFVHKAESYIPTPSTFAPKTGTFAPKPTSTPLPEPSGTGSKNNWEMIPEMTSTRPVNVDPSNQFKRKLEPPSPPTFGTRGRQPKPGDQIGFLTAKDGLIDDLKKNAQSTADFKANLRHLGLAKPTNKKFVAPLMSDETNLDQEGSKKTNADPVDEKLKGIDEKLLERIKNDVIESPSSMNWDDIKGLEFAKRVIKEAIIYPIMRPDLYTGLRRPSKGVLLFGPPGNGKTLIAKCIASTAQAMFFNISASSLTSKWIGEGEMLVRALFTYARANQPAVVFIDEIDSLLSKRSENEHESSRRLKTEFLVFLDGAGTGEDERILIVGATNRPQELDEAVRRRFTKRLYIPLPNEEARRDIILHYLKDIDRHDLQPCDINQLARDTDGYSGADIKSLATEAAMIPMRELIETQPIESLNQISNKDIPPVGYRHFKIALQQTKPSVSEEDIKEYITWNSKYGSG